MGERAQPVEEVAERADLVEVELLETLEVLLGVQITCIGQSRGLHAAGGQGDDDLAEHLQDLLNGGSPMSPQIARRVLKQLRQYASPAPASGNGVVTESALNDLTSKELEILKDLAIGHTYSEVAANLHISLNTVRHHVKSIYSKLYVNSRTQAINTAARLGLL